MRTLHSPCLHIIAIFLLSANLSLASSVSPSTEQRAKAAAATALHNRACTKISPFYWEIGDKEKPLISASVGGNTYDANTNMMIASASKWIWSSYVVQLKHGNLSDADIASLNMTSGYTSFRYPRCARLGNDGKSDVSVKQCFDAKNLLGSNSEIDAEAVGHFYYNGGHFQKQAIDLGLGKFNSISLQQAMQSVLGNDFSFGFDSPQLAGGVTTSAANYAVFLRKILNSQLLMHDALGTHAVCTNPKSCPSAMSTPMPSDESWHYSLGHWVEDDPKTGDSSFSSPGAFGFYAWIDHSKTYYGIVARKAPAGSAIDSVKCGREIRKAWMSGNPQ